MLFSASSDETQIPGKAANTANAVKTKASIRFIVLFFIDICLPFNGVKPSALNQTDDTSIIIRAGGENVTLNYCDIS